MRKKNDIVELFGFAPEDTSSETRMLWDMGACPCINKACTKINHDRSLTYGTCSVTSPYGDIIICPNRLYVNNYETIKKVSEDAFGDIPFLMFDDFIKLRNEIKTCVVALGKNSGKEVQVGNSLSMDWVLVKLENLNLIEYVGIEVQSIDITGNYRDSWHYYRNLKSTDIINQDRPSSGHGLNWANVHKRLIPQIIRKSVVYSRSIYVKKGLYFVVPEIVYNKFEDIIGKDIPLIKELNSESITVMTYELGPTVDNKMRSLIMTRKLSFQLEEFSSRFISGPNLPQGIELDNVIKKALGLN
jgi:hypothetical protein